MSLRFLFESEFVLESEDLPIAFSNRYFAISNGDSTSILLYLRSPIIRKELSAFSHDYHILSGNDENVISLIFSPSSQAVLECFLVALSANCIFIWSMNDVIHDISQGLDETCCSILPLSLFAISIHPCALYPLSFCPSNSLIAFANLHRLFICNTDGSYFVPFDYSAAIIDISFIGDTKIISIASDNTFQLWDLSNKATLSYKSTVLSVTSTLCSLSTFYQHPNIIRMAILSKAGDVHIFHYDETSFIPLHSLDLFKFAPRASILTSYTIGSGLLIATNMYIVLVDLSAYNILETFYFKNLIGVKEGMDSILFDDIPSSEGDQISLICLANSFPNRFILFFGPNEDIQEPQDTMSLIMDDFELHEDSVLNNSHFKPTNQKEPDSYNKARVNSSGYGVLRPKVKMFQMPSSTKSKKNKKPVITPPYPMGISFFNASHSSSPLRFHDKPILKAVYSPDGSTLLTTSMDNTARLVKVSNNMASGKQLIGHCGPVRDGCFSSDNSLCLTSSADCSLCLWNVGRGDPLIRFRNIVHSEKQEISTRQNPFFPTEITCGKFFFANRFILACCANKIYGFKYEIDSGKNGRTFLHHRYTRAFIHSSEQPFGSIACHNYHNSPFIITSSAKCISLFDASTQQVARTIEDAHDRSIHHFAIPHASTLASTSYNLTLSSSTDNCIKLWDLFRSPRSVRRFESHLNKKQPVTADFSPCLKFIATGSEDKLTYQYDINSGAFVNKMHGHSDVVSSVAYNPIRPQLCSVSYDSKTNIYVFKE